MAHDNSGLDDRQNDMLSRLMRTTMGKQRFVIDRSKIPPQPIVTIHVDDAKLQGMDIEVLVRHLIADHGKVVYKSPHPWGEKGTLKITDEPPTVGEVMMPELLNDELQLESEMDKEAKETPRQLQERIDKGLLNRSMH